MLRNRQDRLTKRSRTTSTPGLDVVPANIDLSAAEVHLVNEVAREQILARVLRQVSGEYDVILIDCQPSLGLLTVNALTAAHEVLIPLECEFFARAGRCSWRPSRGGDRLNPALLLGGILATMYDSHYPALSAQCSTGSSDIRDRVFETVIRRTVKFPDASVFRHPDHAHRSRPSGRGGAYRQLAKRLIARGAVA
jgi:chromosome partitioning protein